MTPLPLSVSLSLPVEALREEEMIRSGSREQRKKLLPGGSGSGELDDVTDFLLAPPTVLYPRDAATVAAAFTAGDWLQTTFSTTVLIDQIDRVTGA